MCRCISATLDPDLKLGSARLTRLYWRESCVPTLPMSEQQMLVLLEQLAHARMLVRDVHDPQPSARRPSYQTVR